MADAPLGHDQITGLVLAGGQGSRLGGIDKGLQVYRGQALALTAAQRLSPQVAQTAFSANRHLDTYARWGFPVWSDTPDFAGYQGPLAGVLSGLRHCATPYLVTVPCDCPRFPVDLVSHLSAALGDADLAIARSRQGLEPTFCLMAVGVHDNLHRYLESGQRKLERWTTQLRRVEVSFDDPQAFFNINTPDDLAGG